MLICEQFVHVKVAFLKALLLALSSSEKSRAFKNADSLVCYLIKESTKALTDFPLSEA